MNEEKAEQIGCLIESCIQEKGLHCSEPQLDAGERLKEQKERWNYLLSDNLLAIGSVDYFPSTNDIRVNIYSDSKEKHGQYGKQLEELLQQKIIEIKR